MQLWAVRSEAACKATESFWSATVGMPDDQLPEVPPGELRSVARACLTASAARVRLC